MVDNLEETVNHYNEWNNQGRFAEVLAEMNTLLVTSPDEANFHVLRGNALYGLGRFNEAAEVYSHAIALEPMDVQARSNYGSALYMMGKYVDGLNACDAAILTDKTFAPSYVNAAHCLAALDHLDHAVYALNRGFEMDSENAELGARVAELLGDFGEYEMARDAYFQVAALKDAPADIHTKIAEFFKASKANGIDRGLVLKDVDVWRGRFIKNQEVFRLAAGLTE